MADSRVERLAAVLVEYSTGVKAGDLVLIAAPALAGSLVREIYTRVVRAGGHPFTRIAVEGATEMLLQTGSTEQLEWVNPVRMDEMETVDVHIAILADSNTRSLTRADPAKQASLNRASENIRLRYLERAAAGELRWVLTAFPTNAAAQDAEMSLAEYEAFVYGAALLDEPD